MSLPVSPQITHDETTQGNFADWVYRQELDIAVDFVSNVFRLALPTPCAVVAVRLIVKVASNGTAPTVAVADNAGTPLVYLGTNDLDPSAAAGSMKNSLMGAETAAGGHYYSSPALLTVTLGGTAAPTTGKLILEVVLSGGYSKNKDMINNFPTY